MKKVKQLPPEVAFSKERIPLDTMMKLAVNTASKKKTNVFKGNKKIPMGHNGEQLNTC